MENFKALGVKSDFIIAEAIAIINPTEIQKQVIPLVIRWKY